MKYGLPSDLWSAGVMAYQLVTGRLPFSGEEGEEVSTLFMEKQQFDHKVKDLRVRAMLHCSRTHTHSPLSHHTTCHRTVNLPALR